MMVENSQERSSFVALKEQDLEREEAVGDELNVKTNQKEPIKLDAVTDEL